MRVFANTLLQSALEIADKEFVPQLVELHKTALFKKRWLNTHAEKDVAMYWSLGVQAYFDAGVAMTGPPNGAYNGINTRERLKLYDPELFKLIDATFRGLPWRWRPPIVGVTIPAPKAMK